MTKLTKKLKALDGKIEPLKLYGADEAIALVKKSITDFPVQFGNFRD